MNQKILKEQIQMEDLRLPLKQQEIDLLYVLQNKYRYGNVEIVMRDGLPVDLLKTIVRVRLGELSPNDVDGI